MNSKIFVINMDKDVGRWAMMQRELSKLQSFPYERIPGVYGKGLSQQERENVATVSCAKYCPDSVIGIGMSHMSIWERVVQEDLDYAIVLEDDVNLAPNFEAELNRELIKREGNFDVLLICTQCSFNAPNFLQPLLVAIDSAMRGWKSTRNHHEIMMAAHGYVVSRRGAHQLLSEFADGLSHHIDMSISNRNINIIRGPGLVHRNVDHAETSTNSKKSVFLHLVPQNFQWEMGMPVIKVNQFEILGVHVVLTVLLVVLIIIGLIIYIARCRARAHHRE